MGCFHRSWSVLSCFFVWSVAILRTTDGGNITWHEPPPFETITDAKISSTTHTTLTKGFINEELSCNFSLTADLSVLTVRMGFDGDNVATYIPSTGIIPGSFVSRFSATWVPTKMSLIVFNVTTADAGEYSCEVTTIDGTWTRTIQVAVLVKAEIVGFVTNATTVCRNDVVSFSCSVLGNPVVRTYLLYANDVMNDYSNGSGVWSRTMTTGGVLDFTCVANNTVGTDRRTVAVTVNVPSFIMPISNEVITEGGNLNLSCQASGIPQPTVCWINTSNGQCANGTDLVFRNINRGEAGEYRCEATNPCGNASESLTIDVQFKAEIVDFVANATTVCQNDVVSFNCSADGNPAVHTYLLYVNGNMNDSNSFGVWSQAMTTEGMFNFTCVANNTLGTDKRTVAVTVNVPSAIMPISNEVITEGGNLNLSCPDTGIPPPTVFWVKTSNGQRTNGTELVFKNIRRSEAGEYRCEASNPCGDASESATIDVQYAPEGIQLHVSEDVVSNGTTISFNCSAETSNPMELNYQLYENNFLIYGISSTGVWHKNMTVGGVFSYHCVVNNSVGTAMSSTVSIIVDGYSPINTVFSTNLTKDIVDLNKIFNLTCSADANPAAKYRLYRGQENVVNITDGQSSGTFLTSVNNRVKQVTYRCIPFNSFGDGPTKTVNVTVYYPPIITSISSNQMVDEGEVVQLICTADGNPEPNITWTRLSDNSIVNMPLTNTGKQDEGGYRCTAYNGIGYAASSDVVITVKEGNCESDCTNGKECLPLETKYFCHCPNGKTGENCGKNDILADVFNARFEFTKKEFKTKYEDPDDPETREFKQNVTKAIKIEMNGTGLDQVLVRNLSNGSVIADVELTFSRSVGKGTIEDLINEALKDNKLGELDVGGFTIDGVIAVPEQSTSATPTSAGQPIQEGPPWTIIGAVAGSVVLVALVVAFVTWWVHKKRKCIKDTKIHNSECEESLHGYSPHASVNRAYAESGPPSANGSKGAAQEQSQDPGAIPTYAVVDKSKKKKKAEEKPPIYATVDKSKKRKKKKTDDKNLYDSVEEPKKEKKPGEVTYAELGDFQKPAMPKVSTSPETLPPLKRAPSYEQTQYADITAFLKGDATLPQKEGNEGSEMQQQQSANQSQHDVDNKETPIQEDNGAYAKSGPPSANSTDVSSAAQKQPAQEAGAIPTYAVVDKSKKKKKEPDEMPLVNTDMGKSKKKKKKTDDKNLYDSVEEPKKEKKPGEIFYADLGEFQKQEMPKVATSPPTLPPLKRAPSYEKTDYAEITQFLKKEATLPREKTSNSEMKPQAANQTHDEVENKETPL